MIQAQTLNLSGVKAPKTSLSPKIFGVKVNAILLAQAVKIFLSNQRKAHAKTKTRAEVDRTKAKWFRQKGTGRARHGARSAPIFVGGGKAHGPKGIENYKQTLSKKMRRLALLSALSAKAAKEEIIVIEGLEKAKKTKEVAKLLQSLPSKKMGKFLLVFSEKGPKVTLATRNIAGLTITSTQSLNPYEILNSGKILITKESLKNLEAQWAKA